MPPLDNSYQMYGSGLFISMRMLVDSIEYRLLRIS